MNEWKVDSLIDSCWHRAEWIDSIMKENQDNEEMELMELKFDRNRSLSVDNGSESPRDGHRVHSDGSNDANVNSMNENECVYILSEEEESVGECISISTIYSPKPLTTNTLYEQTQYPPRYPVSFYRIRDPIMNWNWNWKREKSRWSISRRESEWKNVVQ